MNIIDFYKTELINPKVRFFLIISGDHSHDIDYEQYAWKRSKYNLVRPGDLFLYRKKSKNNILKEFLGFFYFCTGLLGIFVFVIINLKKSEAKFNNFIISLFVLFHSVFILHQTLYVINSQFYFPHALLVSTTFSFLYGPLLYFYCKRIMYNYKFKLIDAIHLLPSVILLIYIFPFY